YCPSCATLPCSLFPYTTLFRSQSAAILLHGRGDVKISSTRRRWEGGWLYSRSDQQPGYDMVMLLHRHVLCNQLRPLEELLVGPGDRKSTRLNSSHSQISYAVFC